MMRFTLAVFPMLLATSLSSQMLFEDVTKEIHSPYTNGITPTYDATVDGTKPPSTPLDPVVKKTPLSKIQDLAEALLPPEKVEEVIVVSDPMNEEMVEVDKEGVRASGAYKRELEPVVKGELEPVVVTSETRALAPPAHKAPIAPATPREKAMTAEIRPSPKVRYPTQNFREAKLSSNAAVAKATTSTTLKPAVAPRVPTDLSWFIVVKASDSQTELLADQRKVASLFKTIPVKIHEESGYYFLMAGPAGQDSVGIMMKLVKFNGYPEAATVIAR